MVLGVVFFIAELMTPTYGIFSAGGIISLTIGSLLLFRSPAPFLRVSLSVIIPALVVTAGFFTFAIIMAARIRLKRPTTGKRGMIGMKGIARTPIDPRGKVFIDGAHWNAEAEEPIEEGNRVIVDKVEEGMVLKVRKAEPPGKEG
jgi:membrane-bound serine protease (ClpP class)